MNSKTRDRIRPLGTDRLPPLIGAGLQVLMETYFSATTADGFDVMAEEWDQLIILDGCRYDTFERQNTLEGDLESRTSVGTETPEFLARTFEDEQYPETVYVTANPIHRVEDWCDVGLDEVFYDVVDVWREGWDDTLGTVRPETMRDAIREVHDEYPEHRLVAHFVQPHYPFIGPLGKRLEHGRMNGKQRVEGAGQNADETPVWKALRDGDVGPRRVRQAYEENLWLTLPYLRDLLREFQGTTVVTSDHGNHLGEIATPFPVRLYGHPPAIRTPELATVPWLRVEGENRGKQHPTGTEYSTGESQPTEPAVVSSTDGGERSVGSDTRSTESAAADRSPGPCQQVLRDGPLVSVVIPTYYRNDELASAIESVRGQRYEPIEVLVVDDSGTGHARPVADAYEVSYIEHDERQGANAARTTGIRATAGTYVQLLDDDDRLHPEKIPRQVTVLEGIPTAGVVYCGHTSAEEVRLPNPGARGNVLEETLQFGPKACTNSTMLVSSTVLEDVIPLADTEGADDIWFCIELADRTEFEVITDSLVYKGTTSNNRSKRPVVGRELLNVIDEYDSLYADHPPSVRRTASKKAYTTLARNTLHTHNWSLTAVSAFYRSLEYKDEKTVADFALPVVALFGSPGHRLASHLYRRLHDD